MKNKFKFFALLMGLALLFSVCSGCQASVAEKADPAEVKEISQSGQGKYGKMPRISATSFDGKIFDTDSGAMKGKVFIIDIWASWCPPCREEIPGFIELQKTYGPKGLQVIGISCDRTDKDHSKYAKSAGINYPSVMADKIPDIMQQIEKQIGEVNAIPTTLVVDKKGNIVFMHTGYAPREAFEEIIKKQL
ncbi:TlpA family protein disulfide reductase [bacterium]|nr:TlpA family protein disulfide reductase [bacterium]